ncbi:MAG: outer membrane lipoprotein-sorting protein [Polaribacter sp.]|nr:outer membrane lipoprotein-sorting protein [Polaribacter sp.]MDG1811965.1 outer membrane lipoprotein-sorting protein [Polaribacter sp.]MDG1992979.1 outer membrane lipoprotein-sorting protein [Polaribacter sp.]
MKNLKYSIAILCIGFLNISMQSQELTADKIIQKVDKNMSADTQITVSEMIIYGKRKSRTITSKGYSEGKMKSFSEYLSPAREAGTKMLKLEDRLWIYSPSTDRTIQLSGHMLRQSVMGSDMSYEDMMEDRKLIEIYNATIIATEILNERKTWKLELIAKVDDATYFKRIIWIDTERFVPLKEELFAKSGQLLKKTVMSEITKINGRWYPKKMNYKDMLKTGKGTDFIVKEIQFNPKISEAIFNKSSLKKN